ncbi:MAG: ATP-binding protein [Blautia sp.]|jgi:serine/threonine-protein kinase RsbW
MNETKELIVPAKLDELPKVLEFIDRELERLECSMKTQMQIDIAVEEIYVNIAHYAYQPGMEGDAKICCAVGGEPLKVSIQFIDNGIPYNPLEKQDPNIALSAEDRNIGGLGIFMVKKSMDNVTYNYEDGKNILTIHKSIT